MLPHSPISLKIVIRVLFLSLLSSVFLFPGIVSADEDVPATHKAIVQQVYDEVFNAGKLDLMDEIYASDYLNHGFGDDLTLEDFKSTITAMQAALPDFEATVEVLIAQDNQVASRVLFSGTFENAWVMGDQTIEPNGETITWSLNILHKFNDEDQIVEDYTAFDTLGLLTQLDAAPLPKFIAEILTSPEHTPIVMEESTATEADLQIHQEAFMHIMDDAINNGELTAIDTYMAEDHQAHEPFGDFTREQFKQVIAGFRATVPDLVVTVDDLVIEGDWLMARLTYAGTFSNEISAGLISIKPTNKPIKFIVNVFVHYNANGVSIEDFKEYNRLAWLRQLELIPPAAS
ncbi:MAG TPA: ester cyclase [Phototrophicaceae bacterium]|jgi:predicted ester cyclase|nr:ester cyclase [Phototrophicaceae bacterium]